MTCFDLVGKNLKVLRHIHLGKQRLRLRQLFIPMTLQLKWNRFDTVTDVDGQFERVFLFNTNMQPSWSWLNYTTNWDLKSIQFSCYGGHFWPKFHVLPRSYLQVKLFSIQLIVERKVTYFSNCSRLVPEPSLSR